MNTTIRSIGNSKGIILPKSILTQCDIDSNVSIEVINHRIIISASSVSKRKGLEKAFKEMSENEDEALIMPEIFNDENTDDWTWK